MHRALTLGVAGLLATTSCWHEVHRERVIWHGVLVEDGATITVADEVDLEKSCAGDKVLLGVFTVLTFGLAYIINDVIETKMGHPRCPQTDTQWERQKQFHSSFATVPNAPTRVDTYRPRSCRFDPDDGCTTDERATDRTTTPTARGWTTIERGGDDKFHITIADHRGGRKTIDVGDEPWTKIGSPVAIDVTGDHVVVRSANRMCWLVTRATNAAVPFEDCDYARWLDPHTLWIANRLVDVDTGEIYAAKQARWLGKGLGLAEHDKLVEVVRRGPWRVLATVTPVAMIDEPDALTIIGTTAVVTVRSDGDVTMHPIPIVPGRILAIRGDLALVTIANEQLTAATIRLSTGELVARTP
jgi:hypothetical protein